MPIACPRKDPHRPFVDCNRCAADAIRKLVDAVFLNHEGGSWFWLRSACRFTDVSSLHSGRVKSARMNSGTGAACPTYVVSVGTDASNHPFCGTCLPALAMRDMYREIIGWLVHYGPPVPFSRQDVSHWNALNATLCRVVRS